MTKKMNFKKIITSIPEDTFISDIDGLVGNVKNVTLEVRIDDIKSFELDDTMFIFLEMHDGNCTKIKGIMVGPRDSEFKTLVKSINTNSKYRVSGNISTLDDEDIDLPFIKQNKGDKVLCITALQNYSDTLFGVSLDDLYCNDDIGKEYNLLLKNTDYVGNISIDDIKNIEFSCFKDIIILLKDGTLIVNGEKKLTNINNIVLVDIDCVFAISNDKIITCITGEPNNQKLFINNNDYKYKKVIVNGLGIVALTHDKTIRYFGTLIREVIDGSLYNNVDDIEYIENNDDIIVIKSNEVYSLYSKYKYPSLDKMTEMITNSEANGCLIVK